jgi:hypothetical protein
MESRRKSTEEHNKMHFMTHSAILDLPLPVPPKILLSHSRLHLISTHHLLLNLLFAAGPRRLRLLSSSDMTEGEYV